MNNWYFYPIFFHIQRLDNNFIPESSDEADFRIGSDIRNRFDSQDQERGEITLFLVCGYAITSPRHLQDEYEYVLSEDDSPLSFYDVGNDDIILIKSK